GLSRDRAGFDVRDVHHSHYGRICPIETPEGPNIGLIGSLANYGRLNDFGFIETPYRRVISTLTADDPLLVGQFLREDLLDDSGKAIAKAGDEITSAIADQAKKAGRSVAVRPRVTDDVVYLTADEEDRFAVAQANTVIDADGFLVDDRIETRIRDGFLYRAPHDVDFLDVSPKQMVSVATALIPFLEH
ncbi:MAG: DNA-directed RNA polymerase subunit beta, partial [Dehalococcoidia bacterium]|nr:DNA-directed RNA polymerase subunit beta [Dehalococcoidia bacterium]